MKQGLTLLEILIAIIIIGALASVGFVQYEYVMENFRKTEAKTYLSELRMAEIVYYRNFQTYGGIENLGLELPTPITGCNSQFYFSYGCDSGSGTCSVTRCIQGQGGKNPPGKSPYTISLTTGGNFSP